ncbi:hypothetical protein KWO_002480 [Xanthomonas vasicola pv. musacearum NCPPB 4379]|nr:hypothetical protein KWO_002480 [Xanthomonas vasicola pv. musacearum NCPPB 4379]RRJ41104.1 hypothetical protein EIM46_08965 [Xanthomonas vasicola pv. musacearum]
MRSSASTVDNSTAILQCDDRNVRHIKRASSDPCAQLRQMVCATRSALAIFYMMVGMQRVLSIEGLRRS